MYKSLSEIDKDINEKEYLIPAFLLDKGAAVEEIIKVHKIININTRFLNSQHKKIKNNSYGDLV